MDESGLSSVQRTERCLAAIDRWNPHVNAMVTVDAEGALRDARQADVDSALGRTRGPLHGVPIVIKDNIDTAGMRTTYGSGFFSDHIPSEDAPVVTRLRQAGAVVLGKATLHEFAFGVRSFNPVTGQCRNPYDPGRIPGGSSGGSGVAVATGMAEMALGTDTGGSVRIPAALNGVSGLRPTLGRVSNVGCMPVSPTFDTIGPMARSIEALSRMFAVIAGFDARDPVSEDRPLDNFLPQLSAGIAGLRVGLPRDHYFDGLDSDIAAALQSAVRTLEQLGAQVIDIDLPGARHSHRFASTLIFADVCQIHASRVAQGGPQWAPQTLERIRHALTLSAVDYASAVRAREQWCLDLDRVFDEVDVIVSPTTAGLAPLIEDDRSLLEATRAVTQNTYAGALGKLPGLSIPCGLSHDGLPIGMQLEAPRWRDTLLLRAGWAYQSVTDWHRLEPRLPAAC